MRAFASVPIACSRLAALVSTAFLLAACGTSSWLQAPDKSKAIELARFNRLLIEDFTDEATAKAKSEVQPMLKRRLKIAVMQFPDEIALATKSAGGFDEVIRSGEPDATTLILRGAITEFDEGSESLRWRVGFAAGNVHFHARLQLVDGGTSETVGTWNVRRNSWGPGDPKLPPTTERFLQEAAAKIGAELSARRMAGSGT